MRGKPPPPKSGARSDGKVRNLDQHRITTTNGCEPKLRRLIRAFDQDTDEFVWELELRPDVTLEILQGLLGVDVANPMYDAFPVTAQQAKMLADLGSVDLEQQGLALFVEAEAAG